MKNILTFAFLAFSLCFFPRFALAENANDSAYLAAVDKMRGAESTSVEEWTNLRTLYTKTNFYQHSTGFTPVSIQKELKNAYDTKTPKAMAALDMVRRAHYAALETHIDAANFYHENNPHPDFIDFKKEISAIENIFQSLLSTGDGKSMKQAIKAISIYEQQALMQAHFKLRQMGKTLEYASGKIYDVFSVKYDGQPSMEMFFDITDRMAAFKNSKMVTEATAAANAQAAGEAQPHNENTDAAAPQEEPVAKKLSAEDEAYLALVATAQKAPAQADWPALRKAFTKTSFFKSVGWDSLTEKSRQMYAHVVNRETEDAFKKFNIYLTHFYATPSAHRMALKLAEKYPEMHIDTAASVKALGGILQALLAQADGLSIENAININSGDELSEILETHFSVKDIKAPETTPAEGRIYMHYLLQDPKTKQEKRYYFAIEMAALEQQYTQKLDTTAKGATPHQRGPKDADYERMVAAALDQPEKVDWAALRLAYTDTKYYQPYGGVTLWETLSRLAADAKNGSESAATQYKQLYTVHFAHFMAQENAMKMASVNGIPAALSRTAYDGLITALKSSGDGKSAETAYKVIDIQEEYFLLRQQKEKYKKSPVSFINNRAYDIFDPVTATENNGPIFFDVTVLFQK